VLSGFSSAFSDLWGLAMGLFGRWEPVILAGLAQGVIQDNNCSRMMRVRVGS
jgi:hypothetical protein